MYMYVLTHDHARLCLLRTAFDDLKSQICDSSPCEIFSKKQNLKFEVKKKKEAFCCFSLQVLYVLNMTDDDKFWQIQRGNPAAYGTTGE